MHQLTRICLQNWYLVEAEDIEIDGATALVGPTGAGKSSIADGIQTVLTGAAMNRLNLNPSASGKSSRSVLEYCLGVTGDQQAGGKPLREACETVVALVFRDEETAEPLTVGIALAARHGDSREEVLSRFIAPGFAYSVGDAKRRGNGRETLAPWAETVEHLRRCSPSFEEYRASAEKFTSDFLKLMRGPHAQAPNARHFLRAMYNALAFRPIFDPTQFVREHILEADPLDIGRVRDSIEAWKSLEATIEQIESKLRRVSRLEGRFDAWARSKLKSGEARFASAQAELRRRLHEYGDARLHEGAVAEALAAAAAALAERRKWISEFEEEIRAKRAIAEAGSGGSRIRHLETERRLEERDAAQRGERYRRMRQALAAFARLQPLSGRLAPSLRRAIDAAAEALAMLPDAVDPADALRGKGAMLQALADEILEAGRLDEAFSQTADETAARLRNLQERAELLEAALGQGGAERAVLSPSTTRLLSALERHDIAAVPLCDVVEVVDQGWQYALESLLGRGREALIVEPPLLRRAYDVMCSETAYHGCVLVKTTATPKRPYQLPKGSVLEAVRTGNEHAMAFMTVRAGSFVKAETYEALEASERGVMRDGRTSSAMGLSMQQPVRNLILGKASQERSGEALRNELLPLRKQLSETRDEIRILREAARIAGPARDVLSEGESLFDLEHSSRSSRNRLEALREEMAKGEVSDAAELLAEIEALETDRANHLAEIAEDFAPRHERLLRESAQAEAKTQVAREALSKAARDRSAAWRELAGGQLAELAGISPQSSDLDPLAVVRRVRRAIRSAESEREHPKGWLADFRNDNRTLADQAERDAAREQSNVIREFAEYAANWEADVPLLGSENMAEGYRWAVAERERLEGNELRKHREACRRAAGEMRRMLREDLLARLAEKLSKVGQRLDLLNAHLARHRFTGQTYSFSSEVNGRFSRMHALAMRTGGGGQGDSEDGELDEALAELEDLIAGKEGAGLLADYRQYFVFEINMTNASGERTTMTSRAVKGSGGEAQAPFYVAIAASLASAYFPGHADGRPTGMGLAMFDEAFNKLDVVNTQALLAFFRDMGLQLLIAGPEDKRATYTEALDTIVLVNKSLDGKSVYIDAEYPGRKAREALARINPDHAGIEAFRQGAV